MRNTLITQSKRAVLCSVWCIAAGAVSSCVSGLTVPSVGVRYDPSAVSRIKPCQSTREELIRTLGQPYRKGIVSGHDQWTWYYYPGYQGGMAAYEEAGKNTQNLIVAFTEAGLVLDYVYNPPTNVLWTPEDRCRTK